MKSYTKRGFTLIELLVVVLIIGILAAVALPQYQKAVKKAHGAEALVAADALDKALTDYYLTHDTYEGANAQTLDVQIPELKHFHYQVGCDYYTTSESGSGIFVKGGLIPFEGTNIYQVHITSPDLTALGLRWENGTLISKRCFTLEGGKGKCSDYYNCNWVQVGTGGYCCSLN